MRLRTAVLDRNRWAARTTSMVSRGGREQTGDRLSVRLPFVVVGVLFLVLACVRVLSPARAAERPRAVLLCFDTRALALVEYGVRTKPRRRIDCSTAATRALVVLLVDVTTRHLLVGNWRSLALPPPALASAHVRCSERGGHMPRPQQMRQA